MSEKLSISLQFFTRFVFLCPLRNRKLLTHSDLFIESLVVCAEFALSQYASLPPCRKESASVTHQLCEGSANTQQAYLHAVILSAAVDKQCDGIENDAGETDAAQCCHRIAQGWEYVNGAKHVWQEAEEEQKQRAYYTHGEDHRKEMHEFETLWIFLVEIDAGDEEGIPCYEKFAIDAAIEQFGLDILKPAALHSFLVYLDGKWYGLFAKPGTYDDEDPIGVLDVDISSRLILDDILGIKDLRSDKRIDFVGGLRGLGELKRRVDSGEMKMALALHPVSMQQIMDIADSGKIMPPKATWFEPKLRSGLIIHKLD